MRIELHSTVASQIKAVLRINTCRYVVDETLPENNRIILQNILILYFVAANLSMSATKCQQYCSHVVTRGFFINRKVKGDTEIF